MKHSKDLDYLILSQMKVANIIKDGDEMDWKSPFNQYNFHIERQDNQLWYPNGNEYSKFLISIKISDMLGIPVTELKFSEIDACRILDSMNSFIHDFEHQCYSDMYIYLSTKNPTLSYNMIYLQRLPAYFPDDDDQNQNYVNYDYNHNDIRDVLFQIKQYNPVHGNIIDLLSIQISDEELSDLMFGIFFCSLIDIEIPTGQESVVENVVQNLMEIGYF